MTTFSPSLPETHQILALLTDPSKSFAEIAAAFRTNVHSLKTWLATPEIAVELQSLESLSIQRARLLAAAVLPLAIRAMSSIIQEYTEERGQQTPSPSPARPLDPKSNPQRRSTHQAVLHATRLLIQLASFSKLRSQASGALEKGALSVQKLAQFASPAGSTRAT